MNTDQSIDQVLPSQSKAFAFHQLPLLLASTTDHITNTGKMGSQAIGSLINSISRFIHLVSCRTIKTVPLQKDYSNIVALLKLLKFVLDEVIEFKIASNEVLLKEFEELDVTINEARELMEKWFPKMSKICCVLQSEPLMMKVRSSSLEICGVLNGLLHSSPSSHLVSIQHCMQELQCAKLERTSELIEEALRDQRHGLMPNNELLLRIAELLSLTSNHELLSESMALEKEREKNKLKKYNGDEDDMEQIINLVMHIRDFMFKLKQFEAINGIPIPSYFLCPLSFELMLDPVIVASGQTYERSFIQKWLDQGLRICPKTQEILNNTNLVPNYTVKELIANWCVGNDISNSFEFTKTQSFSASHGVLGDIDHPCSYHSSSHSDSTSHSSVDVVDMSDRDKTIGISTRNIEEDSDSVAHRQLLTYDVTVQCNSPFNQSNVHSWSNSVSSAISSIDYIPTAAAVLTEVSSLSIESNDGEVAPKSPNSYSKEMGSPWLSGGQFLSLNSVVLTGIGNGTNHKTLSPSLDSNYDKLTTYSHVQKLVEDLMSQSTDLQTAAAKEIRLLAKHNMENRVIIAKCGAISTLVSLLYSKAKLIQENAVTALLNLSINDTNKALIAEANAIEPLIHVLMSGNAEAKENSAATLFSLSVLEEYKIKIGRSGAVKALVDLLGFGSLRGKKDAATALFNLSIIHENKVRIVQAGAIKYLVELMEPSKVMADKAIALLSNLATIPEGRMAITREGGIPSLVEVVESGSQRGKENAAFALFQLCINSHKFCRLVLQEGAVPPLVALSQSGTPRAREKAHQILSHFRSQRDVSVGKVKS